MKCPIVKLSKEKEPGGIREIKEILQWWRNVGNNG
jgi:hypothetical protein